MKTTIPSQRQRLEAILQRLNRIYARARREGRSTAHLTNRAQRLTRAWLNTADYNQA
jgi:hypothetical protein